MQWRVSDQLEMFVHVSLRKKYLDNNPMHPYKCVQLHVPSLIVDSESHNSVFSICIMTIIITTTTTTTSIIIIIIIIQILSNFIRSTLPPIFLRTRMIHKSCSCSFAFEEDILWRGLETVGPLAEVYVLLPSYSIIGWWNCHCTHLGSDKETGKLMFSW